MSLLIYVVAWFIWHPLTFSRLKQGRGALFSFQRALSSVLAAQQLGEINKTPRYLGAIIMRRKSVVKLAG